jgi:hypothetical protein
MVGALEGWADVWAMPFFTQVYGFPENEGIFVASMVFFGMCFGGPLLAYCINIFQSINLMIFTIAILTSGIFGTLFYFAHLSFGLSMMLMLFLGVLCCYQALIFALVSDIVDKFHAGITIAIVNCINMSFGHFFHKVISTLMHNNWNGAVNANNMPLYTHQNYIDGLTLIPVACVIGGFGFLYLAFRTKKSAT